MVSVMRQLYMQCQGALISVIRAVFPIEPPFVTKSDEMIVVERLDKGRHGLYPVGDRSGRTGTGRGTT